MSQFEIHHLYCRRFLNQLESAQSKMLKLQQAESAFEFELLFDCYNNQCAKRLARFKTVKEDDDQYRIYKQLGLICRHIEKLSSDLPGLKNNQFSADRIIKYFERQHTFKKVIQRHIKDLEVFLNQGI